MRDILEIPTNSPCTDKPGKGFFEIAAISPLTMLPEVMLPGCFSYFSPYIYTSSQDCSKEAIGAYTGEVSASMIKSLGVKYAIIGHSERRKVFKEENQL